MSVIPAVIEQHAEKAAFLWLLRDASVHEPHHSLFDLAHPDNRVRPILTGSESPEMKGWDILKETLAWEETGEVLAGAVLVFEASVEECMDTVLDSRQ